MAIKSIPLDNATPAQLRSYATDFLNLEISAGSDDAAILALITKAQPGIAMIFATEADHPVVTHEPTTMRPDTPHPVLRPEEQGRGQVGTLGKGDPRCVIVIPMQEGDDAVGRSDVTVGVNGRAWQMHRGVELNIPYRVKLALDNAVSDQVRHLNTEGREGEVEVRKVPRFPYQVMSLPSAAEIQAWHDATDAHFAA